MSRRCRILAIDRSFLLPNSTLVVITFPPSNLSSFATCGSPPLHSSVPCFYPRGYFRLPGHRYTKSVDRRMSPFTDSHTDPVVTVIQWYAERGSGVLLTVPVERLEGLLPVAELSNPTGSLHLPAIRNPRVFRCREGTTGDSWARSCPGSL